MRQTQCCSRVKIWKENLLIYVGVDCFYLKEILSIIEKIGGIMWIFIALILSFASELPLHAKALARSSAHAHLFCVGHEVTYEILLHIPDYDQNQLPADSC